MGLLGAESEKVAYADLEHLRRELRALGYVEGPLLAFDVRWAGSDYGRLVALAKDLAAGKCDLCAGSAPFLSIDGQPYLESHHVKWLSQGGRDALDNVVALCPNCHRKMHVRKDAQDISALHMRIERRHRIGEKE